jgi:hypothetical protein
VKGDIMQFLKSFIKIWITIFLIVCVIAVVLGSLVAMFLLLHWTEVTYPMPYAAILMILEAITYIAGLWAVGEAISQ